MDWFFQEIRCFVRYRDRRLKSLLGIYLEPFHLEGSEVICKEYKELLAAVKKIADTPLTVLHGIVNRKYAESLAYLLEWNKIAQAKWGGVGTYLSGMESFIKEELLGLITKRHALFQHLYYQMKLELMLLENDHRGIDAMIVKGADFTRPFPSMCQAGMRTADEWAQEYGHRALARKIREAKKNNRCPRAHPFFNVVY